MHTTASSLVAIVQYFWRIRTPLFFVYQQKFNIEAVNDYPPIQFEIWFEFESWPPIQFEQKFLIHRSLLHLDTLPTLPSHSSTAFLIGFCVAHGKSKPRRTGMAWYSMDKYTVAEKEFKQPVLEKLTR